MSKWHKTRIKVFHKYGSEKVFDEYVSDENKNAGMAYLCEKVPDDAEYILERPTMPEGFCGWAWADIHRDLITIMSGGSFPAIKREGTQLACCTDGLRPVVFLIERID